MKYRFALLLLTVLLVAGCGQKGPLFLPGHVPEAYTAEPLFDDEADEGDEQADEEPAGQEAPATN